MKFKLFLLASLLNSIMIFSQCTIPSGLFVTCISFNSVLANWTPQVDADHYKIQYRIVGASAWTDLYNIAGIDSSKHIPSIQSATTYQWKIKSFCDSTSQLASNWSVIDTFTVPVFIAAPFNPIITTSLSNLQCNTPTELFLSLSQNADEPDIGNSTTTSDGGYFNISSLSIDDSIGFGALNTCSQIINSVLKVGFISGQNYALINSYNSYGSLVGFFSIENTASGIKVSSISPNDGNNYTSGFTSEIHFTNLFITPNYAGPLHFFTDIESELNDQFYDTSTIIILCNSTDIAESKSEKKLVEIYDIYGRKSKQIRNKVLFYHFSDGTIEKKLIIKK